MCAHDLAGDADIRQARLGAQGERRRRTACKQPFIGRKPLGGPMLAPALNRLGIGAKGLGEMIADAGHHQRMRVGNRHQRQRACISALLGVLRYKSRLGLDIFKIFDDRQRLEHLMAVVDERRHDTLDIDRFIARLELFARKDVDRNFLERQSLEPQGDPNAK